MRTMIGEPRVVEAGRGAAWWGEGWHIFAAKVGTWIGIMVIYILISALISAVPFVGSVGHWLLTPVFMGGLMLGCQAIERNEALRIGHLFEGFQGPHFVPLMIIGAVNMGLALAIALIGAAGVWGSMSIATMGMAMDPLDALQGSVRAMTGFGLLAFVLVLVIVAVFAMLNWFAPALVVLRGATAVEAMKLSFLSCLRNWVPFLVYGAIGIGIVFGAFIVVGGVVLIAGAGAFANSVSGSGVMAFIGVMILIFAIIVVLALIVGPIVFGSTYAGYKDTLAAEDAALGNPAYQ